MLKELKRYSHYDYESDIKRVLKSTPLGSSSESLLIGRDMVHLKYDNSTAAETPTTKEYSDEKKIIEQLKTEKLMMERKLIEAKTKHADIVI